MYGSLCCQQEFEFSKIAFDSLCKLRYRCMVNLYANTMIYLLGKDKAVSI